ncbi:Pirin [hydrothermal vent metagenome]|uniref:Pirin n=1 Tax=hydrothermal vent metagenome TaxID=652676 RepID=A0A3B0TX81_9ZZZZ
MGTRYKKTGADQLHYLAASNFHPANTYFHFSFANYYNADRMNYGVLRVLNDDDVTPRGGFEQHGHRDMEIVSYVVRGQLTHWDSAGDVENVLERGHVQIVTAGDGVMHSELNKSDKWTRFLQIWILPPAKGLAVRYDAKKFTPADRLNKLLHIVGNISNKEQAPLYLNQDVNFYVSEIDNKDAKISFALKPERQAYINNFEGSVEIRGLEMPETLDERASIEISGPAEIEFSSNTGHAHFIIIEMAKETKNGQKRQ